MSSFQRGRWPTQWLASKRKLTTSEKKSGKPQHSSTGISESMKRRRSKPFIDPITGDPLSWQEHISWRIQGIIRHWAFISIFTCSTITAWIIGVSHPEVLIWWNLAASYLAIFVESVVGISMFSQTRRDAVLIRKIAGMEEKLLKLVEHIVEEVEDISEDLA